MLGREENPRLQEEEGEIRLLIIQHFSGDFFK